MIVQSRFLENDKILKDLIQTVGLPITSFTVSGEKKALKILKNEIKKK